ncbi:hypothetical protein SAMN02927900_02691 [Rhizobium mongolense subsp. loessense]|uniref:Uncharacterized protein n=1 Tax=Rhizobium mongolense subsp. loessense TaxID=158890 RepID=A0A1G4RJK0_9HYPH|nr:hypothetical protein [Rhizobium mongolense]SCW56359.1 hypothetical protein SAMN02927900_02691 [Rhizobium mongolense subsp. loessense]
MIFKIVTAKSEVETDDTGTYPDGIFESNRIDFSARRNDRYPSSHERDYSPSRKVAVIPLGLA